MFLLKCGLHYTRAIITTTVFRMFARIRILPVLSLFALLLMLNGCADLELPGNTSGSTPLDQARNYENGGDFQRAADMYWLASQLSLIHI